MSLTYGFYNGSDKSYTSEEFSSLYMDLVSEGFIKDYDKCFNIETNNDMTIIIDTGKGIFDNVWVQNDTKVILSLDAPDQLYNRIDSIVLCIDHNQRDAYFTVLNGNLDSNPKIPEPPLEDGVRKMILASVYIKADTYNITDDKVTKYIGRTDSIYGIPYLDGRIKSPEDFYILTKNKASFTSWAEGYTPTITEEEIAELNAKVNATNSLMEANSEELIFRGAKDSGYTYGKNYLVNKSYVPTNNIDILDRRFYIQQLYSSDTKYTIGIGDLCNPDYEYLPSESISKVIAKTIDISKFGHALFIYHTNGVEYINGTDDEPKAVMLSLLKYVNTIKTKTNAANFNKISIEFSINYYKATDLTKPDYSYGISINKGSIDTVMAENAASNKIIEIHPGDRIEYKISHENTNLIGDLNARPITTSIANVPIQLLAMIFYGDEV